MDQLVSVIDGLAPARTLDVACGTGILTQHLPGEVVALDQSESMVTVAADRMPEVRVVQGDAVPLLFADSDFERVFTSHTPCPRSATSRGEARCGQLSMPRMSAAVGGATV